MQGLCDFLAYRFIFSKEPYQRSLSNLERVRIRRDKTLMSVAVTNKPGGVLASSKTTEKNTKKLQRVQNDFSEAAADVAKRHTAPNIFTSIVFVILYRILSLEYSGKVIAMLPFTPLSIIRRVSMRGISIASNVTLATASIEGVLPKVHDPTQACTFLLIYMLSTFSVKFVVHMCLGSHPPAGADKGLINLLDDPRSQRVLQEIGMDADELKEAQKMF